MPIAVTVTIVIYRNTAFLITNPYITPMEITPARKWALTQIVYQDILDEIDEHFHTLNVEYMPIKGAYLICSGLAEKMSERRICDIDILIHEKDMQKTSDYFAGLENTELRMYYKYNYRPTESIFYYSLAEAKVLLEIHMLLNFPERFVLPTDDLFSRSRPGDGRLRLPSPEDSLLIFLCHIQSHMPFEFRNTYLEEINLLVSQEGFSWEKFWDLSPSTGIEPFIYFTLRLYQKKYHCTINTPTNYLYSDLLVKKFSLQWFEQLPQWARRVFFDLPFVRRPVWLLFYKLFHNKKQN